jgi:hypothetical protein
MNYYYFTNARLFMGILITMLLSVTDDSFTLNCEGLEEVQLTSVEFLRMERLVI